MKREYSFGIIPMYKGSSGIELLLVQHIEGHWAFPKGHPDLGESPLETAKRELQEEAGITEFTVDDKTEFREEYEVVIDNQRLPKIVTYFPAFVSTKQVTPQASEIQNFGWFSYEEAKARVTFPVTRKLLTDFKKYYDERSSDSAA
jgi:bis(5'-nucleosidyl)-tetraphosphatase